VWGTCLRLEGVFWVLWFYGFVVASGAGRDCLCTNLTCSFALMQKNQKIKAVYRFPCLFSAVSVVRQGPPRESKNAAHLKTRFGR
jgi:hypothetical protein